MPFGINMKGEGLRARAIRSSLLTGLNFGSINLLRLGGNLVLTRILFPEAFGIMALIQVVMTGLAMFSDLGIRPAIVRSPRGDDPLFLDTAWVLQMARGVVLWGGTFILAIPIAQFYETPILAELLPVAGLAAVFQGLNSTNLIVANRQLNLGRVTLIEVGAAAAGLVVLIVLAQLWGSVWALAVGSLAAPFLVMVLSHLVLPGRRNRFRFDRSAARDLVGFGKYIFLATMAGFVISQTDKIILGKLISLTDLALFNIAFMFASLPIVVMRRVSEMVFLPLYSKKPPLESAENYRNIARARMFVIGGILVVLGVLAVSGNELIRFLYDERYEGAGPIMVLIATASMALAVLGGYDTMILAAGDSRRYAAMLILMAVVQTSVMFVGIYNYGVVGAALAPLVTTVLVYPAIVRFLRPYGGWVPKQDILFSICACLIGGLALWINWDAIVSVWGVSP